MDIDELRSGLGRAIKARRRAAGLTQEQLGEPVDYSTEWVSRIERGSALPRLEKLVTLAEAIGTTADVLLADVVGGAAQREVVLRLVTATSELPDDAVEVLADAADSLRDKWPTSTR